MPAYYNEIDPYAAEWLRSLIKGGHIAAGDVDERDIRDVCAADIKRYEQCHFFAGIGGWSHALRLAKWPDARPVWTGSCPCQPFSKAGNRESAADKRHLWAAWFSLIRERRPPVVFGEQVAQAIADYWLDAVSHDLECEAYAVGSALLPACAVGAPHERERLWFVANNLRERVERQISSKDTSKSGSWGWRGEEDLRAIAGSPLVIGDRWPRPIIRRVVDGLPECVDKLRSFGNAIVPQVAAEFIMSFAETESQ